MQVTNKDVRRKFLPRGAGYVFSNAVLSDRTLVIDQGDDVVLRLWLPGGINVEDDPVVPWNVYLYAELDEQDHVIVTKLEIHRRAGGPGITAAGLRDVLVGELLDELLSRPKVARLVRRTDSDNVDDWPVVEGDVPPALLAEARRRTQTQRGRIADPGEVRAKLERVAEVTRQAKPGKVLSTLTRTLNMSEGAAKKALRQAREAGLLEHSNRSAAACRDEALR
jgi:hypothetical protein